MRGVITLETVMVPGPVGPSIELLQQKNGYAHKVLACRGGHMQGADEGKTLPAFLFFDRLPVLINPCLIKAMSRKTFPCSSAVEQSTVNRLVAGSIPAGGANF